ncbi:GNAT family N-acetyltransferase [Nocardia pseudobrasiliensis]|uniref:RimJ/RimL family protein N-acetyltransferase n=1 Tax=Nocardia pseudobrasiliensis TaxID=45979 RepID=A0A370ICR4_9NOCA|nr:GNAT family N-acetyltransferase [Nocardia pseudobrasiliensis]RDI68506.1 RimJ/RimL family protein N-acetyltransferase [Nocardia pseudobrasiliensis]
MSTTPPVTDLRTERLVLRRWTSGEIDAVLTDRRLPHWAADFPAEGDRVIAGLISENPDWSTEYGHRLIAERDGGLIIGSIGLFWPPNNGEIEIGYGIAPSRRGRGYATEATRALAEFALGAAQVHTVLAKVELSNPASIRVLEKAGFRHSPALIDEDVAELRLRA